MPDFIQNCNRISQLDKAASDDFLKELKSKSFHKGDFVVKENEVCKYFYFIEEGLTKLFFYTKEKEFIMTFFREGMMFTELTSYITKQPSKYMIMALEPTTVKYIHQDEVEKLRKKHHCIETLFSKLFSMGTVGMMKRISEMLEDDAKARYNHFVNDNSSLLQRISLGDLANYIGITQVTLSRIRAKK